MQYPYYGAPPHRPTGVTLLAILYILAGILVLLLGIVLILGGALLASAGGALLGGLGAIALIAGVIVLVVGIVGIAIGWGLLNLRNWARILALILAILSLLASLAVVAAGDYASGLFGLVIAALIVWYLLSERVRQAFHGGTAPAAYAPLPPVGYGYSAPAVASSPGLPTAYCSQCGAAVPAGISTCPSCGGPVYLG